MPLITHFVCGLALLESNVSLEVYSANLSHILVEIWETLLKYRILHTQYKLSKINHTIAVLVFENSIHSRLPVLLEGDLPIPIKVILVEYLYDDDDDDDDNDIKDDNNVDNEHDDAPKLEKN